MGEVEDAHAVERLAGFAIGSCAWARQTVAICFRGGLFCHLELRNRLGRMFRRGFLPRRRGASLGRFHLLRHQISPRSIFAWSRQLLRRPDYFLRSALCGLRLPMRPLSLPAAGSITALIKVGLPESMAASTARLSSSGVVALTPTPPNASMTLSYLEPFTKTVVAGSEPPAALTSVPR